VNVHSLTLLHIPSHFLTLPGVCDVTFRLPLGLQPCNAFALTLGLPSSWPTTLQPLCLGREPKAKVPTLEQLLKAFPECFVSDAIDTLNALAVPLPKCCRIRLR